VHDARPPGDVERLAVLEGRDLVNGNDLQSAPPHQPEQRPIRLDPEEVPAVAGLVLAEGVFATSASARWIRTVERVSERARSANPT
jgi:hypothetical protein